MKFMTKLAALLLSLMLCLSFAAAEETADDAEDQTTVLPDACTQSLFTDDEGNWSVEMLWYNTGVIFLSVEHHTSDTEADIWAINIDDAFDGDTFDYLGAYKAHAVTDAEDGSLGDVTTVYEDGTGTLSLDGDLLTWIDNADGESHVFGLVSASTTVNYTEQSRDAVLQATTTEEDNSVLSVVIEWSVSETEQKIWNMTLIWDDNANAYTYSDAVCTREESSGEFVQETLYSSGSGVFAVMDDGSLAWTDNADGTGTGFVFVMNTIDL